MPIGCQLLQDMHEYSVPWIGAGSLSSFYETDILNDYKSFDGWEMLYNAFSSEASSIVNNPFFVLYNKYRGTMRIYLYITTPFVATSSYIQNGISVISAKETSILNFLGQPVLDAVAKRSEKLRTTTARPY